VFHKDIMKFKFSVFLGNDVSINDAYLMFYLFYYLNL